MTLPAAETDRPSRESPAGGDSAPADRRPHDEARLARERSHYNRLATQSPEPPLVMSERNVRRYASPPAFAPHPLEFAFHLLGDLASVRVLEVGCGGGFNTIVLARLGASVFAVDVSEENIRLVEARCRANGVAGQVRLFHGNACTLPLREAIFDRVLCVALLHHLDGVGAADEIARVLKPGGVAVFVEPVILPGPLRWVKAILPRRADVSPDEQPLSAVDIAAVSLRIGRAGRRREFGLTHRVAQRLGVTAPFAERVLPRVDAWLLARVPGLRRSASPIVWEVVKADGRPEGFRP